MSPAGNEKVSTLFYKQLESGPTHQVACIIKIFKAQSWLTVA